MKIIGFMASALATVTLLSSVRSSATTPPPLDLATIKPISGHFKMVDSSNHGSLYMYAPTIIKAGSVYHAYFCSAGTGVNDWDWIRHATSTDLVNWSAADIVLRPSVYERANCDPSVVRFNAGDGDYYYMAYSGNVLNVQTVNFIARSKSPEGPFEKLLPDGGWAHQPYQPKIIVSPMRPAPEGAGVYGAGQPSLVVKDGVVHQWYTDTSDGNSYIYLRTSRDMKNWSNSVRTNVVSASIDVKWDPSRRVFVMFESPAAHQKVVKIAVRKSNDGINWSAAVVTCDESCMPDYSHNIGVSGNSSGHLMSGGRVLYSYSAPYDLNPYYTNESMWGRWDLYGVLLKYELQAPPPTPTPKPTPKPTATPASTSFNATSVPVYRFYHRYTGEHFHSRSATEGTNAGYVAEGIGFKVLAKTGQAGTHVLYRCYDWRMHFVSRDPNCGGAKMEAPYGAVYSKPGTGRRALYQSRHPASGDRLTTVSEGEGPNAGYQDLIVLGYVPN